MHDGSKFFFPENIDYVEAHEQPPIIAGSLTSWEFVPMMKIEDFIMCHDTSYIDPFEYMRVNNMVNENVKKKCDMTDDEIKIYIQEKDVMTSNY